MFLKATFVVIIIALSVIACSDVFAPKAPAVVPQRTPAQPVRRRRSGGRRRQ